MHFVLQIFYEKHCVAYTRLYKGLHVYKFSSAFINMEKKKLGQLPWDFFYIIFHFIFSILVSLLLLWLFIMSCENARSVFPYFQESSISEVYKSFTRFMFVGVVRLLGRGTLYANLDIPNKSTNYLSFIGNIFKRYVMSIIIYNVVAIQAFSAQLSLHFELQSLVCGPTVLSSYQGKIILSSMHFLQVLNDWMVAV